MVVEDLIVVAVEGLIVDVSEGHQVVEEISGDPGTRYSVVVYVVCVVVVVVAVVSVVVAVVDFVMVVVLCTGLDCNMDLAVVA